MPLDIDFNKFDTVCYSMRHNIIQLINSAVGMTVQINLNEGTIKQVSSKVDSMETEVRGLSGQIGQIASDLENVSEQAEEGHLALLLGQNLNRRVSANEAEISHIWDCDSTFMNTSGLYGVINDIVQRLVKCEDALGLPHN